MISTHAKEVAGMIAQQVARAEHNGGSAALSGIAPQILNDK
jgi:hypothetical protein